MSEVRQFTAIKRRLHNEVFVTRLEVSGVINVKMGSEPFSAMAADLVPPKGPNDIQSATARKLARAALRAKRDR